MSLYGGTGLPGTSDCAKVYDSLQKNPQITAEPVLYSAEPANEEAQYHAEDSLGKQMLVRPVFQPRKQPTSKANQSLMPKPQVVKRPQVQKTRFETWTKDTYDATPLPKRQRRNKRSKELNWDDEYDPTRPSVYEEYKNSNEQSRMLDEYQEYLYCRDHLSEEDEDDKRAFEIPDATSNMMSDVAGFSGFASSQINEQAPQSISTPGQKNFAKRLLHKYGWEEGQGLGAASTGITKPLTVKQKQGGHGKIVDKNKPREISLLVVLDGLDMTEEDVQDIGDECSRVYGQIERILVKNQRVFIQFCSLESAARAAYALDGRVFDQDPIQASYFSLERFHNGDYG